MSSYSAYRLAVATLALGMTSLAHAGGGPDAYGYTWTDSADPGGPPAEWIDISAVGTLVTGLGDDNAAATPIPLPLPFRFYWRDYATLKIGSNGWVGFENINNIASCFPTIPSAGGPGDGYLAPLMGDLNFTGAGNPGSVRTYHDAPGNRFIISYDSVPFWMVNAPGWTGSNSFQVILNYSDRSIHFNYRELGGFSNNAACVDLTAGIEGPGGAVGLSIANDALPPANRTVRFVYPEVPLLNIVDPAATAVLNATSVAEVHDIDVPLTVRATIGNDGNADATTSTQAQAEILSPGPGGSVVFNQTIDVAPLPAGASQTLDFAPTYTVLPGKQAMRLTLTNSMDPNVGNNIRLGELIGVSGDGAAQRLSYVQDENANGSINWNGGATPDAYGMAVSYALPEPDYLVTAIGLQMSSSLAGVALELRDNDGPDGLPGTVLSRIDTGGALPSGVWSDFDLPTPVVVDKDFYLVWYQQTTTNFLATSASGVPSRRVYELLNGTFATYRESELRDPFLRVTVSGPRVFSDGFE